MIQTAVNPADRIQDDKYETDDSDDIERLTVVSQINNDFEREGLPMMLLQQADFSFTLPNPSGDQDENSTLDFSSQTDSGSGSDSLTVSPTVAFDDNEPDLMWHSLSESNSMIHETLLTLTALLTIGELTVPLKSRLDVFSDLTQPILDIGVKLRSSGTTNYPSDFPTFAIPGSFRRVTPQDIEKAFEATLLQTCLHSGINNSCSNKDVQSLVAVASCKDSDELSNLSSSQSAHSSLQHHQRDRYSFLPKTIVNRARIVFRTGYPELSQLPTQSSFERQPSSPELRFCPEAIPYDCPFCGESQVSLITFTNHVNVHHKTVDHVEKIRVICEKRCVYVQRSVRNLQIWRAILVAIKCSSSDDSEPSQSEDQSVSQFALEHKVRTWKKRVTQKTGVVGEAPITRLLPKEVLQYVSEVLSPVRLTPSLTISSTTKLLPLLISNIDVLIQELLDVVLADAEELMALISDSFNRIQNLLTLNLGRRNISDSSFQFSGGSNSQDQDKSSDIGDLQNIEKVSLLRAVLDGINREPNIEALLNTASECSASYSQLGAKTASSLETTLKQQRHMLEILTDFQRYLTRWSSDKRTTLLNQFQQTRMSVLFQINMYLASLPQLGLEEDVDATVLDLSVRQRVDLVNQVTHHLNEKKQHLTEINIEAAVLNLEPTHHSELECMINRLNYVKELTSLLLEFLIWLGNLRISRLLEVQLDRVSSERLYFQLKLKQVHHLLEVTPIASSQPHPMEQRMTMELEWLKKRLFICDIDPRHMKQRHWEELAAQTGKDILKRCFSIPESEGLISPTFGELFEAMIEEHEEEFRTMSVSAFHESKIETELNQMTDAWHNRICLEFVQEDKPEFSRLLSALSDTWADKWKFMDIMLNDCFIVSDVSIQNAISKAQNSLTKILTLHHNKYINPFLDRIHELRASLAELPSRLQLFMETQTLWVNLRNLFGSRSVINQIEDIYRRFIDLTEDWARLIGSILRDSVPFRVFGDGEAISHILPHISEHLIQCKSDVMSFLKMNADLYPSLHLLPIDTIIASLSYAVSPKDLHPVLRLLFPGLQELIIDSDQLNPLLTLIPPSNHPSNDDSDDGTQSEVSESTFRTPPRKEVTILSSNKDDSDSLSSIEPVRPPSIKPKVAAQKTSHSSHHSEKGTATPLRRHSLTIPSVPTHPSHIAGPVIHPIPSITPQHKQPSNKNRRKSFGDHSFIPGRKPLHKMPTLPEVRNTPSHTLTPNPKSIQMSAKGSEGSNDTRLSQQTVRVVGFVGCMEERILFHEPLPFFPDGDRIAFFETLERALHNSINTKMIESIVQSFPLMILFFDADREAINGINDDGMDHNHSGNVNLSDSESSDDSMSNDYALLSIGVDPLKASSPSHSLVYPRRPALTKDTITSVISGRTPAVDQDLITSPITFVALDEDNKPPIEIHPTTDHHQLKRSRIKLDQIDSLSGYLKSLVPAFPFGEIKNIHKSLFRTFLKDGLDQTVFLALTTHLNKYLQDLTTYDFSAMLSHFNGFAQEESEFGITEAERLLQHCAKVQKGVVNLIQLMQLFLGQDPRLQLRMKIETAIVSLFSALSFIQTLVSVISHRDVNLLNSIVDAISSLPHIEVDFTPTVKSLADSYLSRLVPRHNSKSSNASSQGTTSELPGSRPSPTFETSVTSLSLDPTSFYADQLVTVMFGKNQVQYNSDYTPFVQQHLFSWGIIEPVRTPFKSIENIPRSVRTVWFWQEIAQVQKQSLSPTFHSRLFSSVEEEENTQATIDLYKPAFTLIQSQSPSAVNDRIQELAMICGRTVFSFSLDETINFAKSLVPFIHGVIGGGKWALLENIDVLPTLTLNALIDAVQTINSSWKNGFNRFTLTQDSIVIIHPHHIFATVDLPTIPTLLPEQIRTNFRPIVLYRSDDEAVLFTHLAMSGYQYASTLAARTIDFFKTYQQATKQSNAYILGMIQQVCLECHTFSFIALDQIIRPILSTSFKHKDKFTDPLLEWLNSDDTVDTLIQSLREETGNNPEIVGLLAMIPSVDHPFLEYSVKKEKLLFIFEALSISLAIGEFARFSFFPGDPLIATTIFRLLFPEFSQQMIERLFSYSDSLHQTGLPSTIQEVDQEYTKSPYPEVSQYNKTLISVVTQLISSDITFSQDLATALLSDGSSGRDNAMTRLITASSVSFPFKTTRYQKFAVTLKAALKNDLGDGLDDESTQDRSRSKLMRRSSSSLTQSGLFGKTSIISLSSLEREMMGRIPQFVTISSSQRGSDADRSTTMDVDEMLVIESADLYETLKMNPRMEPLKEFKNLASPLPTKPVLIAGMISCVMQLNKMLHNPIWSAPVTDNFFRQTSPIVLLGPARSGKSSVINSLAVAQTQLGIPTRVVRVNASARTISQLIGTFEREQTFSEEEEMIQSILTNELQYVTKDGNTELELSNPPKMNTNTSSISSVERWIDGIIPAIAKEGNFLSRDHSRNVPKEEIFLVFELGSAPIYQVSSTCDDTTSAVRGHKGRPPIAEMSAKAPDLTTGWMNKLGTLLNRSTRYQTQLRSEYFKRVAQKSRAKKTNLEKTGVLMNNPFESEQTTKTDIVELLLSDYHQKMNNMSNPIKQFRRRLIGLFPTLQFFKSSRRRIGNSQKKTVFRQRQVQQTIKDVSRTTALFAAHAKKGMEHEAKTTYSEGMIRKRYHTMTRMGQLPAERLNIVDQLQITLGARGGNHHHDEAEISDSVIISELAESLFRSNSLRIQNQQLIRFNSNIRILFETDSLDHIPVDFASGLSILHIPDNLFSKHTRTLYIKEVPLFSPSASVVFEYVYSELVTDYVMFNPFVTENWLKDSVLSNIYRHIVFAAGIITMRVQDAGLFVRQYFNNQVDSSPTNTCQTDPNLRKSNSSTFNRLFGRSSAFFENVASTFLGNTLALYKAHMKYLLPVILMGIFRQYQSIIPTTGDQNINQNQLNEKHNRFLDGWGITSEKTLADSSDPKTVLLDICAYSVFWGVGGHAFMFPEFTLDFSKYVCNRFDINPSPSTLHKVRTHPHTAVQNDIDEVRRKLKNEGTDCETLADYIINLSTGIWEKVTNFYPTSTQSPLSRNSHTITVSNMTPVSRHHEIWSQANSPLSHPSPLSARSNDKHKFPPMDSVPLGNEITFQHTHALYNQVNHSTIMCMDDMEPIRRLSNCLVKAPHTIPHLDEPDVTFVCPISPLIETTTLSDIVTHIHQAIHLTTTASLDVEETSPREEHEPPEFSADPSHNPQTGPKQAHTRLTSASVIFQFFPPFSIHTLDFVRSVLSDGLVSTHSSVSNSQNSGLHLSIVAPIAFALWLPPRYLKVASVATIPGRTLVLELGSLDQYFRSLLREIGFRNTSSTSSVNILPSSQRKLSHMNLMSSLSSYLTTQEMDTLRPLLGLNHSIGSEAKLLFMEDHDDERAVIDSVLSRIPFFTLLLFRLLSYKEDDVEMEVCQVKQQMFSLFPELIQLPLPSFHPTFVLQRLVVSVSEDRSILASPSLLVVEWMKTWEETIIDRIPLTKQFSFILILTFLGNLLLTQSPLSLDKLSDVLNHLPIPNSSMICETIRVARTKSFISELSQNTSSKFHTHSILMSKANDPHPINLINSVTATAASTAAKIKTSSVAVLTYPHMITDAFIEEVSNCVDYPVYHLQLGSTKLQFLNNIREMILTVINSPQPVIITFEVNNAISISEKLDPIDLRRQSKDMNDDLDDISSFRKPKIFFSTRQRVGSEAKTDADLFHPDNPVLSPETSHDALTPFSISMHLYILAESNLSLLYFFTNEQMRQILADVSSSGNKEAQNETYLIEQFRQKHRFLLFITHYTSNQGMSTSFSLNEQRLAMERERVRTGNMFFHQVLMSDTSWQRRKPQRSLHQFPGLQLFGWFLTSFQIELLEPYTSLEHQNTLKSTMTLGKIRGSRMAEALAQWRLNSSILYSRDHYLDMVAVQSVLDMLNKSKKAKVKKSISSQFLIDENVFPKQTRLRQMEDERHVKANNEVLPTPPPPPLPNTIPWVCALCFYPQPLKTKKIQRTLNMDNTPKLKRRFSHIPGAVSHQDALELHNRASYLTEDFMMEPINDTDTFDLQPQPTHQSPLKFSSKPLKKLPSTSPPQKPQRGRRPSIVAQRRASTVTNPFQKLNSKRAKNKSVPNTPEQTQTMIPFALNEPRISSDVHDMSSILSPSKKPIKSFTTESQLISHFKHLSPRPLRTKFSDLSSSPTRGRKSHLLHQVSSLGLMTLLSCEKEQNTSLLSVNPPQVSTTTQLFALEKAFIHYGQYISRTSVSSSEYETVDEDTLFLSCIASIYQSVRDQYQYFSHVGAHTSWMTFRMAVISPPFLDVMSHALVDTSTSRMIGLETRRRKLLAFHSTLFEILLASLPPEDILKHVLSFHFSTYRPNWITGLVEQVKHIMANLREKKNNLRALKQEIHQKTVRCRDQHRKMDAAFTRDRSVTVEETQQRLSMLKVRDLSWLKRNVNPPVSIRYLIDILFIILRRPLPPTSLTYITRPAMTNSSTVTQSLVPMQNQTGLDLMDTQLTEDEKVERLVRGLPVVPKTPRSPTQSVKSEHFSGTAVPPKDTGSSRFPVLRRSMLQSQKLYLNSHFLDELVMFDPHLISDEQIELIQPYFDLRVDDAPMDKPEVIKMTPLFDFVSSVLSHHRIKKSLIPHKTMLETEIEADLIQSLTKLNQLIIEVDNERVRLITVLHQIQSMFPLQRIDPTIKKSKLTQEQVKLIESMMSDIINELEIVEQNIVNCRGDSTLAGAFITFNGCIPISEWEMMMEKWQRYLVLCDIPFSGAQELWHKMKQELDDNQDSKKQYLSRIFNSRDGSSILRTTPPPNYRCLSVNTSGVVEVDDCTSIVAKSALPHNLIPTWNVLHGPASFFDGQANGLCVNMPSLFFIPLLESATNGQPIMIFDHFGFGEQALLAYFRTRTNVIHVNILDTEFFSHAIDALVNGLPLIVNYFNISQCLSNPRLQNLIDFVLFGQEVTVNPGFRLFIINKNETAILPSQEPCLYNTIIPSQCRMINMAAISMESAFKSFVANVIIRPALFSDMITRHKASYGRIAILNRTLIRADAEITGSHDVSSRKYIDRFFFNISRLKTTCEKCRIDIRKEIQDIHFRKRGVSIVDTLVSKIYTIVIALHCVANVAVMTQIENNDVGSLIREPYSQYGVPTVQQVENFLQESIRRAVSIFEITQHSKLARSHLSSSVDAHLGSNHHSTEHEDREVDDVTGLIRLRTLRPLVKSAQKNLTDDEREMSEICESIHRGVLFRIITQMRSSIPQQPGSIRSQNITFPFLMILTLQNQIIDDHPEFRDDPQHEDPANQAKESHSRASSPSLDYIYDFTHKISSISTHFTQFASGSPYLMQKPLSDEQRIAMDISREFMDLLYREEAKGLLPLENHPENEERFLAELASIDAVFHKWDVTLSLKQHTQTLQEHFKLYRAEWIAWTVSPAPEKGPYPPQLCDNYTDTRRTLILVRIFPYRSIMIMIEFVSRIVGIALPTVNPIEDIISLSSDLSNANFPLLVTSQDGQFDPSYYVDGIRKDYSILASKEERQKVGRQLSRVLTVSLPKDSRKVKIKAPQLIAPLRMRMLVHWGPYQRDVLSREIIRSHLALPTIGNHEIAENITPNSIQFVSTSTIKELFLLFGGHLRQPSPTIFEPWQKLHQFRHLERFVWAVLDSTYVQEFLSLPQKFFETPQVLTPKQLADSQLVQRSLVEQSTSQTVRTSSFMQDSPKRYAKLQLEHGLNLAPTTNDDHQRKVTISRAVVDRWRQYMIPERVSTVPLLIRCDPTDKSSIIQHSARSNRESEGLALLNAGFSEHHSVILRTNEPKIVLPTRPVPTSSIVISGVEQSTNSLMLTTSIGSSVTLIKTEFDSSLVSSFQTVLSWISPEMERQAENDTLSSVLLIGISLIWALLINRLKIAWYMQIALTQSSDVTYPDLEPNHALAQPHTLFSQPFFLRIVEWILVYVASYRNKVPDLQEKINRVYSSQSEMYKLISTSPTKQQISSFFTEGSRTLVRFFWTQSDLPSQEAFSVQFLVERMNVPDMLLPSHNFFSLLHTSVDQIVPLTFPLPLRRSFSRRKAIAYLSTLRIAPPPAMFQSTAGSVQVAQHNLSHIIFRNVEILVPLKSEKLENRRDVETLHRETFHGSLIKFISLLPPQIPLDVLWKSKFDLIGQRSRILAEMISDEMFTFNQTIQTLVSSLACFSRSYTSTNPLLASSLSSASSVVSPFTTRPRTDLPSFFLAMTPIPYHVSHRFRDVILWLRLSHKFLSSYTTETPSPPSLFPLSLLVSPSAFFISQLIELNLNETATHNPSLITPFEHSQRLSISFVCRDPFSFTPGESFQTIEDGEIGSYVIGIAMNGFAWDFENGVFVETRPGSIPPPTVTQYPVVRITRHRLENDISTNMLKSARHQNRWVMSQIERYIDLSGISPFTPPTNLISTQLFRLLSVGARTAHKHSIHRDNPSSSATHSSAPAASVQSVGQTPSPHPTPGQDKMARKMHLVNLFSSAAKRSVLAEVNVENEDFSEWERKGCYLFLDFNPDLFHALQTRFLPV
ncbi:putative Dynein heavy chain, N-terminal region 2 [Blattamonas nauphoetae]|uniref:Dynein heavy chain, N-terminal region 2 n=1 Tax=Blattamonas nauphoetae TaxID=2049346 RepID=A0ABQ9Y3F4_9EUKA|nr:putative Dynein heavy chain, N-terminal region 2 [Blattamonas nauphoetae]